MPGVGALRTERGSVGKRWSEQNANKVLQSFFRGGPYLCIMSEEITHPNGVREISTSALKGLAHPLRMAIYDALSALGPQTATTLAKRLGESSGSTSYHLRQRSASPHP